jgi:small redox-active disulfide protein 2
MKIQVLGSGCSTCKHLFEITKKVIDEMGLVTEVEYITGDKGIQKMVELGAMSSPVLAVNDHIAMTGFTPDIETVKEKIKKALDVK